MASAGAERRGPSARGRHRALAGLALRRRRVGRRRADNLGGARSARHRGRRVPRRRGLAPRADDPPRPRRTRSRRGHAPGAPRAPRPRAAGGAGARRVGGRIRLLRPVAGGRLARGSSRLGDPPRPEPRARRARRRAGVRPRGVALARRSPPRGRRSVERAGRREPAFHDRVSAGRRPARARRARKRSVAIRHRDRGPPRRLDRERGAPGVRRRSDDAGRGGGVRTAGRNEAARVIRGPLGELDCRDAADGGARPRRARLATSGGSASSTRRSPACGAGRSRLRSKRAVRRRRCRSTAPCRRPRRGRAGPASGRARRSRCRCRW